MAAVARPAWRWFLSSSVALVAGLVLSYLVRWPAYALAVRGIFSDDAYFYSALARGVRQYRFLTINGEMPTNGVQPLWMAAQVALAWLLPAADTAHLLAWASWVGYLLFAGAFAWYLARGPRAVALVCCLAGTALLSLNGNFIRLTVRGLETPAMLLTLALLLVYVDRVYARQHDLRQRPLREHAVVGLLAGLVFLARVDLWCLPLAIGLWMAGRRMPPRSLIAYAVPLALLVAPYLACNLAHFHGLLPISGRVKMFYVSTFYHSWGAYLHSDDSLGVVATFSQVFAPALRVSRLVRTLLVAGILGATAHLVWRSRWAAWCPRSLKLLGAACMLHLPAMHLLYRSVHPNTAYYFAPEVLWVVSAGVWWLYASWERHSVTLHTARALFPAGVVILCALTAYLPNARPLPVAPYWEQRYLLARDVSRLLPPDARVAAYWPGLFAQFGGHPVAPLDGIIGSPQYFRQYVQTDRVPEYLLQHAPCYLLLYLDAPPEQIINGPEPLIRHWSFLYLHDLRRYRDAMQVRTVTSRCFRSDGRRMGWYLLAVTRRSSG